MRKPKSPIFPIITIFIVTNVFFLTSKNLLERNGFDQEVLIVGNLILFIVTLLSFWLGKRSVKSSNPQAFVRAIYLSTILKLLVCTIAAFIYIFTFRSNLNKPSLFTCLGLYVLYTVFEISILTKLLRKNA